MLAPVVVNPDTISNSASINDGICLEKKNGRHPIKLIRIQLNDTQTSPSREWNPPDGFRLINLSMTERTTAISIE